MNVFHSSARKIRIGKAFSLLDRLTKAVIFSLRRATSIRRGHAPNFSTTEVSLCNKDGHVFFGYYDLDPFNYDDRLLLANLAPLKLSTPSQETFLEVGYYDLHSDGLPFARVAKTNTWCWQQGCRLQWYPADRNSTKILYNCLVDRSYGCVVQDIETKRVMKRYNRPIYVVSRDGRWGLSLNFSRLQRLRPGYGYKILPDETQNQLAPKTDGIWLVDMVTGDSKLLISLDYVANGLGNYYDTTGAEHYFNHLSFNPSATRFMFFHLWMKDGQRRSRLVTADIQGNDIHVLENLATTVSHYTWKDNTTLLATINDPKQGFFYALYDDSHIQRKTVARSILGEDGHPSYMSGTNSILTDTYPDKRGLQVLLLFNENTQSAHVIGEYFSPARFRGEFRCDLHPRFSRSNQSICIDNVRGKNRIIRIIRLNSLDKQTP